MLVFGGALVGVGGRGVCIGDRSFDCFTLLNLGYPDVGQFLT